MADLYDLVVRNGNIADGTGAPIFAGDVAIKAGRIAAVGKVTGAGAQEIDAAGKLVTPGFVDVHTHYDGQITWENTLAPSSNHGVTTVVMGNCGVGFAPVRADQHDLVIRLMEGVEDIPDVVMAEGVPWNWETFPDYLDALDKREADVDFAAQLPHSPLRVYVMGQRGADLEPPTEDDLAQMRGMVTQAIKAGALGVSTSRNLAHRFRSGAFAPSVKTEQDELVALGKGLADAGSGVFQINPNLDNPAAGELAVFNAIAEASGRPLNFSLIANPANPGNWDAYVQGLKDARSAGVPIRGQFLPRPIGVLFGLDLSYHPFSLNPSYRAIADRPLAEKVARMQDPALRAHILSEQPEDPNPFFKGLVQFTANLFPLSDPPNYNPPADSSIAAMARARGVDERGLIYDELLKDDGHAILYSTSAAVVQDYLVQTDELYDSPNAVVGLGDGGAHYGMICDAAYTTFLLIERLGKNGIALPRMIKAISADTAASVGLQDRGVVAEGYKADLNIIDLDHLALGRPRIKADLPGGGKRLTQASKGYVATIVSGVVTQRDGRPTGALPGRLVRGARQVPATAQVKAAD